MEGIVVQTVAEHLRVNTRAAPARVLKLFDDQRSGAFAHDESVAQLIERPASERGIASPTAHCFDQVECAERKRRERRFGSTRHHYLGKIIADVSQRFADCNRSAGATIRVRRANSAKPEFD